MVQYDDAATDETVRIYDRGMDVQPTPANFGEYQLTYRSGDMVVPRIDAAEPLGLELADFARPSRPAPSRARTRSWAADRARDGGGQDVAAPPRRADRDQRADARGSRLIS